jgi:hypothetical protein
VIRRKVHGGVQQEPVAGTTPHILRRAGVEAAETPSQPKTGTQADGGRIEYKVEGQGGIQGREEAAMSDSRLWTNNQK